MKKLFPRQKELLREKIVGFAKKFIGVPYKYGARVSNAPRTFDCSSFVQYVYRRFGYKIPRSTIQQATFIKKTMTGLKNLEPGDLLYLHSERGYYTREFPQGIGHVAMYIGNGLVIHASGAGRKTGVQIENIKRVIESRKPLVVIKRII